MRRWAPPVLLLVGLLAGLPAGGGPALAATVPSAADEVAPRAADPAALARAYADSDAQTERRPPGWSEYVGVLIRRFGVWISELLGRALSSVGIDAGRAVQVAWGVLALALAGLGLLVYRRLRRRSALGSAGRAAGARRTAGSELDGLRVPVSWRAEIDRRLAEGRVADALEAIWWWLARSLCGERAETSWTGRELVLNGRRPELRAPVARLEAWVYGPRPPLAAEVGEWVRALEPRLAAGGDRPAGGGPGAGGGPAAGGG